MTHKTDWVKTLANIIFHHDKPSIEFTIADVEEIRAELLEKDTIIAQLRANLKQSVQREGNLESQLLMETLKPSAQSANLFKIYA